MTAPIAVDAHFHLPMMTTPIHQHQLAEDFFPPLLSSLNYFTDCYRMMVTEVMIAKT